MIAIDNKLISESIIEAQFVCDLNKCKGACCEDGDAGAPLLISEKKNIDDSLSAVLPYLSAEGLERIKEVGSYQWDDEFGWVTPTVDEGICAYGLKDKWGIIQCGFEKAFNDGKTSWKKPISCHLFPVRIVQSQIDPDIEYLNYEYRPDTCGDACSLGNKLKVPVYKFLKDALVRKYGIDFYTVLDTIANTVDITNP